MLSRFSALACVAVLGISLPGAQGFAQETPQIHSLSPSSEEIQVELIDFGASVAINGRTALVGIPYAWQRLAVFTRNEDGTWARTGSIENPQPNDGGFATAMAIHGKRLAVPSTAAIRLYEQQGSQWRMQSIIHTPNGSSRSIAYDGKTLAFQRIQYETDPVTGLQATRQIVSVYRIGRHGEATLVRELRAPLGEGIGGSLAVRADRLVVAGNSDSDVHVYWNDRGAWRLEQKFSITSSTLSGGIGAVAIHGRHIVVGIPGDESIPTNGDGSPSSEPISGAVYVFTKLQGQWRQTQRVRPDYMNPQMGGFSSFGGALAASGKRVAIGAPTPLDNDNGQFGQTYVYRWDGDTLVFDLHLQITGTTLSMTPRRLIIGTNTYDHHANPVTGARIVDFGDRDPTDDDEDDD